MRILLAVFVLLLPFLAHSNSPQPPACSARIAVPSDGSTNVPIDVVLQIVEQDGECARSVLTDQDGTVLETVTMAEPLSRGRLLRLTPRAPLAAGHRFTLQLLSPLVSGCPDLQSVSRFTTAPAPAVIGVSFLPDGERIVGVSVALSEQVSKASDLEPQAGLLNVEVLGDGSHPIRRDDPQAPTQDRGRFVSFKVIGYVREDLPRGSATFRVTLKRGLPFASGAALPADFSLDLVPDDWPFGWAPGRDQKLCAANPEPPPQPQPVRAPPPSHPGCSAALGEPLVALAAVLECARQRHSRRGAWRKTRR